MSSAENLAETGPETAFAVRWSSLVLLFLAILTDGFDTAAFSFVVPVLGREWGRTPAEFTPALVATNVGVVVGYLVCSKLTARWGRRAVVWSAVAFFSVSVLTTALAGSVAVLTVIRFVTGVGLGAVLPAAVSLGATCVPVLRRGSAAIGVTLGISAGGTVSGLVGGAMIAHLGWQSVFWLPGVLSMGLAVLLWWKLVRPEAQVSQAQAPAASAETEAAQPVRDYSGVRSLLSRGLAGRTALLWGFSFLALGCGYIIQSWLPTLLVQAGYRAGQVSFGTAAFSFGALVAGVLLVIVTARWGIPRVIAILCGLGVVCLGVFASTSPSFSGALVLSVLIGIGTGAATKGQSAIAVLTYPENCHTAGVAWSAALGRVGSIAGPGLVGLLLSLHVSVSGILSVTTFLLAGAGVLVVPFIRLTRRSPRHQAIQAAPAEREQTPAE
ncbi:MFS transporter [Amycolatopsis rhabdoformis]|uniref:MFS transporter n=1 Tax=Amycolatopsis rhabdoformis TaxID=1448059 RepID=A0ABZ1IJE7_9PSEU|nr:MFS transporter [Amycolatopsis rhabdoformis]WSE33679.1 MFS transporter [Amycolatopsis rhabdoformis]